VRLEPDNFVKRALKPILKELGLDGAAHAFRHGNATLLDSLHAPMAVRQERLGHVDARTTMGYDLPRFSQPFVAGVSRFRFVGEYISPSS
jgi:integrase